MRLPDIKFLIPLTSYLMPAISNSIITFRDTIITKWDNGFSMLKGLFSSRVRSQLLIVLFLSAENGINAHELSRRSGESYGAVWKELAHLEQLGILMSEKIGNVRVFRIDPRCPITPELRGLVLKTEGFGEPIRASLAGLSNIQAAFIYGSFASGEIDSRSDIDLMVIGELDLAAFSGRIAQLETELHRPINYAIITHSEWLEKVENNDPFVLNVRQSPKVMLIGVEDGL